MLEEWSLVLETWLRYCCCEPLTLFPPHDLLTERLLCHFDLSKRAGFKVFTKVVELVRKVYEMSSGIKIKPKLPPLILWLDVLFPQDLHVPWLPYDKTWVCSSMSHQNQYLRSKITTYNLPFLQYFGYKKKMKTIAWNCGYLVLVKTTDQIHKTVHYKPLPLLSSVIGFISTKVASNFRKTSLYSFIIYSPASRKKRWYQSHSYLLHKSSYKSVKWNCNLSSQLHDILISPVSYVKFWTYQFNFISQFNLTS